MKIKMFQKTIFVMLALTTFLIVVINSGAQATLTTAGPVGSSLTTDDYGVVTSPTLGEPYVEWIRHRLSQKEKLFITTTQLFFSL